MTKKKKNFFLDEVVSIEPVGVIDTYDFCIPETSCFFANDILVHNTGSIEEMADAVLLMHRPTEAGSDGSNISIEVAKNRFGPTGPFGVYFDGETFRFYNSNQEAMRDMIAAGRK